MAKARTRPTKKAAAARVDELFDDGAGEHQAALEEAAAAQLAAEEPDRRAADEMGAQPPPHVPDPRGDERAWESYPATTGRCATCSGALRITGPAIATCKRGHENELRADDGPGEMSAAKVAAEINAGTLPGFERSSARVVDETTLEVRPLEVGPASVRTNSRGARVVFHERPTTRLEHLDFEDFGNITDEGMGVAKSRVDGAFVKVSAALRPSEREGFDGRRLKEELAAAGARAVLLAVHPVAEAPDREAKAEAASSSRPEDAIAAWFDGLPVPEDERAEAKAKALEILAAEGG